jgi:prophage antirepressor-like protein
MVGEQTQPRKAWNDIKNEYTKVVTFCNYYKFKGQRQRDTPCVNAKGLVLLLMKVPGEKAKQFRSAVPKPKKVVSLPKKVVTRRKKVVEKEWCLEMDSE